MMFSKDKADCPFWRGPCREQKCRLYVQIMGQNPNTGEQLNRWGCSFEFIPMLMIENSQQQRQTGAAVESFRNEVVRANEASQSLLTEVALHDGRPPPKLVGRG